MARTNAQRGAKFEFEEIGRYFLCALGVLAREFLELVLSNIQMKETKGGKEDATQLLV